VFSVVEDDSALELSVCPEGVLTVVSSAAVSVPCLSIVAGVSTAASSGAASVPCLLTAAGVTTAASSAVASVAGSSAPEDVPTSISTLALDLSIVAGFLTGLSVDLDFHFLLQGLVKPSRLLNCRFWVEDSRRFDLRMRTNTRSSDFKSLFIPVSSRILLIVVGLAMK
jgi:hypothetical protein